MSEGHKFKVLEYIKQLIYRVSMADFCFFYGKHRWLFWPSRHAFFTFHHDLQHLLSYVPSDVIQCVCLGARLSEFQTDYVLHATEAPLIVAGAQSAQILQGVVCFNCRNRITSPACKRSHRLQISLLQHIWPFFKLKTEALPHHIKRRCLVLKKRDQTIQYLIKENRAKIQHDATPLHPEKGTNKTPPKQAPSKRCSTPSLV